MSFKLKNVRDEATLRTAAELLERENQRLTREVIALTREVARLKGQDPSQLELKLDHLQQQIDRLQQLAFGPSSEQLKSETSTDEAKEPERSKKGGTRKEQPRLRHVEVEHKLERTDPDRLCEACNKPLVVWAGQTEDSEEIEIIRREFVVVKHKREKYRCKCGGCIETAPAPLKLFPGARYSIDFAVEVAVQKYEFHMPLTRQVRAMRADGLETGSQTLWDQTERVARLLAPTWQALRSRALSAEVVFADETRWKMLMGEHGARGDPSLAKRTWQIWTLATHESVYYEIQDGRGSEQGRRMLGGYTGVVMCDGYKVYSSLASEHGSRIALAHCWAHARREFWEIRDRFPIETNELFSLVGELYALEQSVPNARDPDALAARRQVRREHSAKVIERIKSWCLTTQCLPESGLAKAIGYVTNHWTGLTCFLSDPRIPLDNNIAERANRGPVVGRKNHYGSKSRRGTEVSALFYSIVETAKLCNVDARDYLRYAVRAALRGDPVLLPHDFAAAVKSEPCTAPQ